MPDWLSVTNLGLVGVLFLFVWKLPDITRQILAYLEKRQEARDRELDKLAEVFRADRVSMLATFREELKYEREQNQVQFTRVIEAVEKNYCGFASHHQVQMITPPATGREVKS